MKFFVYGMPKPQPRPRACMRGKHAGIYDAGTANGWKYLIARTARDNAPEKPFDCAVGLSLVFVLPRPKNHYLPATKSRPQETLRQNAPILNTTKPDIDNYVKAVMDALTDSQVIWRDDAQVVMISASKIYEDAKTKCGVEISIEDLEYE
jgi:uncharacterized protein yqaN|nr:MAG TPA: Endodeoxyribonuclease RusA [Caudoviricetes sp.]